MQIALDPYMFRDVPLLRLPGVVADLGYEWIELSPRDDVIPFFRHPRIDLAGVRAFRRALEAAGGGVCSTQFVQRWSGPGEDERRAAVRNVRRILEGTTELGVPVVQSEFNGRPELPESSEARFLDSFDPRGSSGLRYIVNPPDSTARVHQHLDLGEGEVDADGVFAALGEIGFDGAVCSSVFAWEERREDSSRLVRRRIQELVGRW